MRGTNGDVISCKDIVAFTVRGGRQRLSLNFLPQIPGISPPQTWIGDTQCDFHLTNSQFGVTDCMPVLNRVLRLASGSDMEVLGTGKLDLFFLKRQSYPSTPE